MDGELFIIDGFPSSEGPVMIQSSVTTGINQLCSFTILSANCSSWGEVSSQELIIPESCSGIWAQIILTCSAQEQGTQYDRFGAVWIGNLEVLRTTTAEPARDGITWYVEKDISDYRSCIQSQSGLNTYISIPNNVDSTYTGIISATITLTIYANDLTDVDINEPTIMTLTNATEMELYDLE